MVDIALLGYAFGVGMIAFLNPCGFALLPAYVAHYLSLGSSGRIRTCDPPVNSRLLYR
jgi:cytochrome c biogenesis protein CcdA